MIALYFTRFLITLGALVFTVGVSLIVGVLFQTFLTADDRKWYEGPIVIWSWLFMCIIFAIKIGGWF